VESANQTVRALPVTAVLARGRDYEPRITPNAL